MKKMVCYCGRELVVGDMAELTHADGVGRQCWPDEDDLFATLDPDASEEINETTVFRVETPESWSKGKHYMKPKADKINLLTKEETNLLADAAQIYVDAFTDDDKMTLLEAMMFTSVKDILEKMGRSQQWDKKEES